MTLVPGATGSADAGAHERASALAELRAVIARATRADPDHVAAPAVACVLAPARRSRDVVDGTPDVGASGIPGDLVPQIGVLSPVHDAGERHRLDLGASVAVILLRLAGWEGAVRTVEIGGEAEVASGAEARLTQLVDGPGDVLLVVATMTSDGRVPQGAAPWLLRAEARTHEMWALASTL